MNAKEELLGHIENREVKYVCVNRKISYNSKETFEGTLDEVLPKLDFEYHNGYGSQELAGIVWYSDGTWSDRGEYDGSEWWEYRKCPPLPTTTDKSFESVLWRRLACDFRVHAGWKLEGMERSFREIVRRTLAEYPPEYHEDKEL